MTPTKWILALLVAYVAWVPTSVQLGRIAAHGQDPAGQGIYSAITTIFLLVVGAVALGIPGLLQARKHKQQIHACLRLVPWLILLSPVLVPGAVILFELIF